MKERVSVIVTCFNYGRFVAGALKSLLVQTKPADEIIVVNDGSTDDSELQIQPFLENPSLRYVRQTNAGQAVAKNYGARLATGDILGFLDADDRWAPQKLERQLPLFSNARVGVVYSGQTFIDENDRPWDRQPASLAPRRGRIVNDLLKDNMVPFSSALLRRSCFNEAGGFNESLTMAIDWDLWLRCALHWEFDFVPEPLLLYRQGHAGQMSQRQDERLACADRIFTRFVNAHRAELSAEAVREAEIYTFNSRGFACRRSDPLRSFSLYGRSFLRAPFQWSAFVGMVLALTPTLGRRSSEKRA